jgi:hypothetical protein
MRDTVQTLKDKQLRQIILVDVYYYRYMKNIFWMTVVDIVRHGRMIIFYNDKQKVYRIL